MARTNSHLKNLGVISLEHAGYKERLLYSILKLCLGLVPTTSLHIAKQKFM